jgi:hypothetical protein
MGANPIQHVPQRAGCKAMPPSVASVRRGTGCGWRVARGAQPHRSHCQGKHSKVRGLPRQPNMRLKLTARGGRLRRNWSLLSAAAAGRSLSAIR